jgi:hypothetical protein
MRNNGFESQGAPLRGDPGLWSATPSAYGRLIIALAFIGALHMTRGAAHADIFQWEYINPADPRQGKQQSMTLCPDGAGVDAAPSANLSNRNLTMAYLIGADLGPYYVYDGSGYPAAVSANLASADLTAADLRGANFNYATLTGADFNQGNLTDADFGRATLTDVDFTGSDVRGANFYKDIYNGTGITLAQLYSTASYQAKDLSGITLPVRLGPVEPLHDRRNHARRHSRTDKRRATDHGCGHVCQSPLRIRQHATQTTAKTKLFGSGTVSTHMPTGRNGTLNVDTGPLPSIGA